MGSDVSMHGGGTLARYLVTGATGFVGGRLCALLVARGHAVRVYRRATSSLALLEGLAVEEAVGALTDVEAVARAAAGCDGVFNVAGLVSYARRDGRALQHTNVDGARAVCEGARRAGVRRLVHTSSVAAVGHATAGGVASEDTAYNWPPGFAYMETKRAGEDEVRRAAGTGFETVVVNPSVVMGPGEPRGLFRPVFVPLSKGMLPFYLPGGTNVVDVDDLAAGHLLAMEKGRSGERYILGGENAETRRLMEEVAHALGVRAPPLGLPSGAVRALAWAADGVEGLVGRTVGPGGAFLRASTYTTFATSAKAERELGYTFRPLRETVHRAVADYRARGWLT